MASFYGFSGVLARRDATQTIPTSTITKLFYDFERYDTDGSHALAASVPDRRDRFVVPSRMGAAFYLVEARVRFAPINATAIWRLGYEINAEGTQWLAETWTTAGQTVQPTMAFTKTVYLEGAEFITVGVWQSTGGPVNTSSTEAISGAEVVFRRL